MEEHYLRLNTEKYGGMILSTWLDRSTLRRWQTGCEERERYRGQTGEYRQRSLRDPQCGHPYEREMNKGVEYNPQVDLLPLLADVSFDEYDAHTTYDAQTARRMRRNSRKQ